MSLISQHTFSDLHYCLEKDIICNTVDNNEVGKVMTDQARNKQVNASIDNV